MHLALVDLLGVVRAAERALRFEGDLVRDSGKFETARVSMPSASITPRPVSLAPDSLSRGAA